MKGLLFTSFGTSFADTRAKTIDAIRDRLREEFPDLPFYEAWTSARIIAKVKAERGEHHDTLDEALAKASAAGVDDLTVATTCLLSGGETAKITRAISEWAQVEGRTAHLAEPMLASRADRRAIARVLADEFAMVPDEDALLLMGHGSTARDSADPDATNAVYPDIQKALHDLGRTNFFVATVEGTPLFEDAVPLVEAHAPKRVWLAPLMFVAGDHAKNDLAGEDPDSWASRLAALGYETSPVLRGLGEYAGIHQLICDHVRDALIVQEVAIRG